MAALRQEWKQLSATPVVRAERVAALVRAGSSRRAVARALHIDEGSVRRDLKIAALPVEQKSAVQDGTSLAAAPRAAAARWRAAEASLTQQYAELMVAWVEKRRLWPACAEQLVTEADLRLWMLALSKPQVVAAPPALAAHAQVIAGCRPRTPMPSEMEFLVEWLFQWLRRLMPEKSTRQEAFRLALQRLREKAQPARVLVGAGQSALSAVAAKQPATHLVTVI